MAAPALLDITTAWPHLLAFYAATLLPLVVGLPPIIAIMESVHVMTQREIWKQLARFWAVPFRIALLMAAWGAASLLALGLAASLGRHGDAGITLSLALVGCIAALLWFEILLLGRFMRDGWILPTVRHLANTWLLVAPPALMLFAVALVYGWMDNPVGTVATAAATHLRITEVPALLLNPAAQVKFVHLTSAAYVTAATGVLATSAWYLLRRRNVKFARCALTVAASFGFAAALSLAVLGDTAGYAASPGQQMKLAAIAAEWHTQEPPAAFALVGLPDADAQVTRSPLQVPWLLGWAATHSWRKPVPGISELRAENAIRIRSGAAALADPRPDPRASHASGARNAAADAVWNAGYGLLLLRQTRDPARATDAMVALAADTTIPNVPILFWTFRGMALLGAYCIALFAAAFYFASRRQLYRQGFLRSAWWSLPVPWFAGALGWIVNEVGRGPWLVSGLLPQTATAAGWLGQALVIAGAVLVAGCTIAGAVQLGRAVYTGPDGLKFWPADSGQPRAY